ncbi:hypothetical protein SNOG_12476 [Parastagonospora nodorum SN15]|uniref:Uncharacterized protein n=1 Tax=Phaeosphaeria nodorum (strain SN15 / ATCC MYA-4574 / FGSC 10173) TaxID=321614 RepID=Q0U6Y8_PHANO|nr:hypothetical protein SNOG_12476 [Parastagonospora nodorum SN15]EAT80289.2 hypothetical protein SNOG_12476 [Parastagonospora nodorum SN15]
MPTVSLRFPPSTRVPARLRASPSPTTRAALPPKTSSAWLRRLRSTLRRTRPTVSALSPATSSRTTPTASRTRSTMRRVLVARSRMRTRRPSRTPSRRLRTGSRRTPPLPPLRTLTSSSRSSPTSPTPSPPSFTAELVAPARRSLTTTSCKCSSRLRSKSASLSPCINGASYILGRLGPTNVQVPFVVKWAGLDIYGTCGVFQLLAVFSNSK